MSAEGDITHKESLNELRGYRKLLKDMKTMHLNEIRKLNTEITEMDMSILEVSNDQKTKRIKT